jgi:hypothetical protein
VNVVEIDKTNCLNYYLLNVFVVGRPVDLHNHKKRKAGLIIMLAAVASLIAPIIFLSGYDPDLDLLSNISKMEIVLKEGVVKGDYSSPHHYEEPITIPYKFFLLFDIPIFFIGFGMFLLSFLNMRTTKEIVGEDHQRKKYWGPKIKIIIIVICLIVLGVILYPSIRYEKVTVGRFDIMHDKFKGVVYIKSIFMSDMEWRETKFKDMKQAKYVLALRLRNERAEEAKERAEEAQGKLNWELDEFQQELHWKLDEIQQQQEDIKNQQDEIQSQMERQRRDSKYQYRLDN